VVTEGKRKKVNMARQVCEGSLQPTPHTPGTKNPCAVCGKLSTTKKDGTQRSHAGKKKKE